MYRFKLTIDRGLTRIKTHILFVLLGLRGTEITAVNDDAKRNGLHWKDVDLDDGVLVVYRKSRQWERVPLFEPALKPLRRWKRELDPATEEWPVLPTFHLPLLYALLPDNVAVSPATVWRLLRAHDKQPPSLTVDGLRRTLSTLREKSGYEFEELLKP